MRDSERASGARKENIAAFRESFRTDVAYKVVSDVLPDALVDAQP